MGRFRKFNKYYEKQANNHGKYFKYNKNEDPRFNSGICLLCGEHFDVLLHCHSQQHGYKNAYEQIDDNKVKFDWELGYRES